MNQTCEVLNLNNPFAKNFKWIETCRALYLKYIFYLVIFFNSCNHPILELFRFPIAWSIKRDSCNLLEICFCGDVLEGDCMRIKASNCTHMVYKIYRSKNFKIKYKIIICCGTILLLVIIFWLFDKTPISRLHKKF